MNEQEMFLRVGELSGRVGYPMPTLNWVEGVIGEDCIQFKLNPGRAAVLTVHDHVGEFCSVEEQELQITQHLVRSRVGFERWAKRFRSTERGLFVVLGLIAGVVSNRVTDKKLLGWFVSVLIAYAVMQVLHLVLAFVVTRRFSRRADQALIEVVGRDRVLAWLKSHLGDPRPASWRPRLRWLWSGAPPWPAARLRMLGEKVPTG